MGDAKTQVGWKGRERTHFKFKPKPSPCLLSNKVCMGILGIWDFDFSFLIASKYLSQDLWGAEVARLMEELGTFGSLGLIA